MAQARRTSKARGSGKKRVSAAAAREVAHSELIARKLAKVAPDDDPAQVAGAIAIFATETIKRSANNLMEARAYLDHPVLGPRLMACVAVLNAIDGRTAHEIFGSPDDLKFRSSLTLFLRAAPGDPTLQRALDAYFYGQPDPRTLAIVDGRA